MDIISESLRIARIAHKNQRDKAGSEYILHPLRLMMQMKTEDDMVIALLHDVLEDSNYTADALYAEGIPLRIIEIVSILTRKPNESYSEYINRILQNKQASKIKKIDIEDNLNLLRLSSIKKQDFDRIKKYHKTWNKINNFLMEKV